MRRDRRRAAWAVLAALLALAMVLAGVPTQGMAEAVEEVAAARESDALVEETPAAVEDASGSSGVPEVSEDDALSVEGEVGEPEVADVEVLEAEEEAAIEEAGPEVVGEGDEEPSTESADEEVTLEAQSATVSDPRVVASSSMEAGQRTTWDCVWLGSYPQTFVTDAATVAALDAAAGWSASGDLTYGGATYRRLKRADVAYSSTSSGYWDWGRASAAGYCYFKWEPVKWRVLEADDSTALVVADVALDNQRYQETDTAGIAWVACDLRAWLGRTFRDDALTPAQQAAVVPQTLANNNNIYWGTFGGNPTTDQVFLLSESDVWSTDGAARHGFAKAYDVLDEARRCRACDYAHAMGAWTSTSSFYVGNCFWWLRSPGCYAYFAAFVCKSGNVNRDGDHVLNCKAVRPALSISLSSDQVSYAGTVSSDGAVSEQAAPYSGVKGSGAPVFVSDLSAATVTAPGQTYTGKALEPAPTVTLDGATLVAGTDYDVSYTNNVNAGTATVTITGKGDYAGTATGTFKIARAKVAAPTATNRTYNGKAQTGVAAGAGYKLSGTAKATNAGTYTATATPDANHCWADGTAAAKSITWSIAKAASSIKLADQAKAYTGKAIAYSGKVTRSGSAGKVTYKYYSDAKCAKAVKAADVKGAGTYYVRAKLAADANHKAATSKAAKLTVKKAAQPMKLKAVKRTAKVSKLKKKAVTVAKPLKFTKKAQGKVTYAKVAKGSAKCLTVNKKTGKVKVKRGTKKGTYKVKIKVTAKGTRNYKAGSKTITCKVVVK